MTNGRREQTRETIREMIRNTIDVLGAVKDEVDQTIEELRAREDVSPERARAMMQDAMRRAQDAMDEAKERLDVVPRKEFDALRDEVDDLRRRVATLEGGGSGRIPVEGE